MGEISAEYKHDRSSFDINARKWTKSYAIQNHENQEDSGTVQLDALGMPQISCKHQTEASKNLVEHRKSIFAALPQPHRCSLSFSKRLTLDGRTAGVQEAKAALPKDTILHKDSVSCLASSPQKYPEEISLLKNDKTKRLNEWQMREKKLKDDLITCLQNTSDDICLHQLPKSETSSRLSSQAEQSKDLLFETPTSQGSEMLKSPLSSAGQSETCCGPSDCSSSKEVAISMITNQVATGLVDNMRANRFSDGEGLQSDISMPPISTRFAATFDAKSGDARSLAASERKENDSTCAEKENQPPKLFLAKPKTINPRQLAEEKGFLAESNIKKVYDAPNVTTAKNDVEKAAEKFPLTSRKRSLKLSRTNSDSSFMQQNKEACKDLNLLADKNKRNPMIIPDNAPFIVVSDSGSDSEQSDECTILFLTPRNLKKRSKCEMKLR